MKKTLITTSLIAALFAMPAMATQDEIDQKTVTSKYYVDQELATKQDTISTNKVLFLEADGKNIQENIYVPAIVATNAAGTTLNGNTIGVVDYSSYGTLGAVGDYDLMDFSDSSFDSFVPTVHAVAQALNTLSNNTIGNILPFSPYETTATNNYSVTFDGTKDNWPSDDINKFVNGEALAAGLALKQNKIVAGTAGNVVTYTGTAGQVGSTAVSSAAKYSGTTLTNGGDIANIAAVETAVAAVETAKQDKMTCAGYVPGHENDINYCWLYGDVQVAAAAAPQCTQENEACDPVKPNCCSGLSCYEFGKNSGVYQCM